MAIPGQTLTIRDPGMGITEASATTPLVIGCASSGTVNTIYTIASKVDASTTFGQGPLPECLCRMLDEAGGPIHAIRATGGTAASCGAVTKHAVGASTGTVTVAGQVPYDAYEVQIEITATGALGVGRFKFSLDDGYTWSVEYTIPGGATFAIPSTNITATFVPGAGPTTFEDGDWHEFDCVAPLYTTVNLGSAITAALAAPASTSYAFVVLTGQSASGADAATMFATVATSAASFAAAYRYARFLMDGGIDTYANVITAMSAVSDRRIAVCYGRTDTASAKPFEGYGTPRVPLVYNVAARAAASLISTDLARVMDGSLNGVVLVDHDDYVNAGVCDAAHLTAARTWPGRAGYYITNCWLKSPAGSDFRYWQHGRIMDVACARVIAEQQNMIGVGVRTQATTGYIDERDAVRWEAKIEEPLREDLTQPTNAEGTQGHVSDVSYKIGRTNNVNTTETIQSETSIRPLGYVKQITSYIGFDLSTGAEE